MSVPTPQRYKPRSSKRRSSIEAMRFVGSNVDAIAVYQWVEKNTSGSFDVNSPDDPIPSSGVSIDAATGEMVIATPLGIMGVSIGDWVIRLRTGGFTVMSPTNFNDTYEKE